MGGIINKEKLIRLRAEIEAFRGSIYNVRPDDLVSLARSLGREKAKRGKHPTYVSTLVARNPISIPGHPTIKPRTAASILDELEADINALWDLLDEQERKK
jgi:hypothetical protein